MSTTATNPATAIEGLTKAIAVSPAITTGRNSDPDIAVSAPPLNLATGGRRLSVQFVPHSDRGSLDGLMLQEVQRPAAGGELPVTLG
jgi:hypothetical protein